MITICGRPEKGHVHTACRVKGFSGAHWLRLIQVGSDTVTL